MNFAHSSLTELNIPFMSVGGQSGAEPATSGFPAILTNVYNCSTAELGPVQNSWIRVRRQKGNLERLVQEVFYLLGSNPRDNLIYQLSVAQFDLSFHCPRNVWSGNGNVDFHSGMSCGPAKYGHRQQTAMLEHREKNLIRTPFIYSFNHYRPIH